MHWAQPLLILLLIIAQPVGSAFGQYDDRKVTVVEDGQTFYKHTVKKKQTLYGISKHYGVSLDVIKKYNPSLATDGLQPEQVLRFPAGTAPAMTENPQPAQENRVTEPTSPTPRPELELPDTEDGRYVLHKVEAGQTLFSLTQRYGLDARDIEAANNGLPEGLKAGSWIRIPAMNREELMMEPATNPTTRPTTGRQPPHFPHIVEAGETIYSLARDFNVRQESIRDLNGGLPNGLRTGETILIPRNRIDDSNYISRPSSTPDLMQPVLRLEDLLPPPDSVPVDTQPMKPVYHVALMLPFYLDLNDTSMLDPDDIGPDGQMEIYPKSKIALDFYLGARLALDSLEKQGLQIKLHVYDTGNDSSKVIALLHRPEMKLMNLFIGPLFKNNFDIVSTYAKSRRINIVSPVQTSSRILLGNPHVSKVAPSSAIQSRRLSQYVLSNHRRENLLLINSMKIRDQRWIDSFKREADRRMTAGDSASTDTIPVLKLYQVKEERIRPFLDTGRLNVLIVPSVNRAFVSEIMIHLNEMKEDYRFLVFGLDRWQTYDNLDVDFLHDLKVHLVSPMFVDYERDEVIDFLMSFRDKFETDPGKYSFLGFDVTYFYLGALNRFGTAFPEHLDAMSGRQTMVSFDFFKMGEEHGFENEHVHVLRYRDFKLEKAE